jgi:hypothetical protein
VSSDEQDANKTSKIPGGRSFAGAEIAEDQADQARGRRESAATREDNGLGPHDQEFSEDTLVSETSDAPIRTDAPAHEQAPPRSERSA